ncbi:MAG: hypothetical protein JWO82_2480 [Akkermansiaceae bacterium]|nr:hypothetical protein [Akkermansiaceae bacterium]
MIFCLGSRPRRAYNAPAMTRTQIEKSVYVFTFFLVVAFCYALYRLALQVGIIG